MKSQSPIKYISIIAYLIGIIGLLVFSCLMILIIQYSNFEIPMNALCLWEYLTMELANDNPLYIIFLAFVPAILSISYPLIISNISRLESVYNSTHIVDAFNSERLHKIFKIALFISVTLCFLSSVFMTVIAIYSTALSVAILLIVFLLYANLILAYNNGQRLFIILNDKLKSVDSVLQPTEGIRKIWTSVIDLYVYACVKRDIKLKNDIYRQVILESFSFIRSQASIEYPEMFYANSQGIVSKYVENPRKYKLLNYKEFIGGFFFLFKKKDEKTPFFSEQTLRHFWINLEELIEGKVDEGVKYFWESSQFYLRDYRINYREEKEVWEKEQENRRIFIQFHTVLGAYVYYKKNVSLLKYLWHHSISAPAESWLVMSEVTEVFKTFRLFSDIFKKNLVTSIYRFRGLNIYEMGSSDDLLHWVRRYCTVLFLRIWSQNDRSPNQSRLPFPKVPVSQADKREWKASVKSFKFMIEKVITNDRKSLKKLGLVKFIEPEYLVKVLKYFDDFTVYLDDEYKKEVASQALDQDLIKDFNNHVIKEFKSVFHLFSIIGGQDVSIANRDLHSEKVQDIRGSYHMVSRELFLENTGISYIGYEENFANDLIWKYKAHILSKFHENSTVSYEVAHGALFDTVDKLKLDSEKHVVVAFNIQDDFDYREQLSINGVDENERLYNGISIYLYEAWHQNLVKASYVIRKEDLPMIKHVHWKDDKELPDKARQNFEKLELLDEETKLYYKIWNTGEFEEEGQENLMVKVDYDFIGYCWFKRNIKMVEITERDMFQEGGGKKDSKNIEPF